MDTAQEIFEKKKVLMDRLEAVGFADVKTQPEDQHSYTERNSWTAT